MSRFEAGQPTGIAVQELEGLVRTAVFKPANQLVGWLLQQAADRSLIGVSVFQALNWPRICVHQW